MNILLEDVLWDLINFMVVDIHLAGEKLVGS